MDHHFSVQLPVLILKYPPEPVTASSGTYRTKGYAVETSTTSNISAYANGVVFMNSK